MSYENSLSLSLLICYASQMYCNNVMFPHTSHEVELHLHLFLTPAADGVICRP
jgi:hypothetical protein